jgi:hypothetical protein
MERNEEAAPSGQPLDTDMLPLWGKEKETRMFTDFLLLPGAAFGRHNIHKSSLAPKEQLQIMIGNIKSFSELKNSKLQTRNPKPLTSSST